MAQKQVFLDDSEREIEWRTDGGGRKEERTGGGGVKKKEKAETYSALKKVTRKSKIYWKHCQLPNKLLLRRAASVQPKENKNRLKKDQSRSKWIKWDSK